MGYRPRASKYGAKIAEYNGVKYHSKAEARYAYELDLRRAARDIRDWEGQIRFDLVVNGVKVCRYTIDFKITHNDDSIEYVEVKGVRERSWVMKHKLWQALNPDLKCTIVDGKKKR